MDTFTTLWNRLQLRAPVGPALAQDLIRDAFNQLVERREWSWLMRTSSFYPSIFYQTGSASVSPNTTTVTGTGTAWTADFVGSQFRIGAPTSNYPTYTILAVLSPTSILLDRPWSGGTITNAGYQIFQCYFPVPADFQYFVSLVNTTANYRLWTNITQAELDLSDPQRVQSGITYAAAFYDYTQNYTGTVGPIVQVRGTGPAPISTTSSGFSFPASSIFTVEVTTGGAVGASQYKWKQDAGTYTTAVTTDSSPQDLSFGVQVYWPTGTYVLGDVFVIQCSAQGVASVPRYELWPRPINTPYVYPYLYAAKLPALSDAQPQLPPFVQQRGDVVLEMALSNAAKFPGTETMRNPYFDLTLARMHGDKAERMIYELELKDDNTAIKDLTYKNIPFYPAPWLDGSWLQTHAIYANP